MDFRFSAEDRALQKEAIEFTKKEWQSGKWDTQILINWHHQVEESEEAVSHFEKKLVKKGWWTMHWPKEFGGQAIGIETQLAYREAMAYAGAPASFGGGLVAPVLMLAAPKWMQDEFLPRIASADLEFSQGFSEPDAGSDLASLKTRAVRDGDDYVISGQKIWGTYRNPWIHILVRTDPEAPKHRGITYLLAPLKNDKGEFNPGVTVRKIPDLLGRHRWDELFMENWRVPARYILGEENRGWYTAMTTLSFERSNIQTPANLTRIIEDYIEWCRTTKRAHGSSPLDDKPFRNEIADLRVQVEALRMLCYRVGWMQSKGEIPQKESSMTKLWADLQSQKVYKTLSRGLGEYSNLLPYNKGYKLPSEGFLNNRAVTSGTLSVAGGTTEVQRQVIAQRGLGLPR
jgi:alkylation response protein AidB-like acyl-CoA dehydrogenase